MQFDWWTFALQIINFAVLAWLLQRFLYRPVRRILRERHDLVHKEQAAAKALQKRAQEEKERLQHAREDFEATREQRLKTLQQEIEKRREDALANLQSELDAARLKAKTEIASDRKKAIADLEHEIADLAKAMTSRILSERHGGKPEPLSRLRSALSDIPALEKERIGRDLAVDGAEIKIVTATQLSKDQQGELHQLINKIWTAAPRVRFLADAALIDGGEVHFPHAVLKASDASFISQIQQGIMSHDDAN